jgi:hypothetical protein
VIGSQVSVKCSETQVSLFVLLTGFSTQLVLITTCFGLSRPLSGCTLSYYKANYNIHNVFVFVNELSCTSIKFAFKIITVAVELKSYSNIKGVNSIKFGCCDLGNGVGGGSMVSNWGYSCLAMLVFLFGFSVVTQ